MRPFKSTIPFGEALERVMRAAVPITDTESIGLGEADGRVVAGSTVAAADVPPFDRAAMDGYAVVAGDTAGATRSTPRVVHCLGQVFTGQAPGAALTPGQCIEIATGAPMPAGADAVVMVEETERDDDQVRIFATVTPRQNVGPRAADFAAGHEVLHAGDLLTPSRIGVLAAVGLTDVEVFRLPRVAILSTGNELVEPGLPLAPGQIYDINRYTLASVIRANGGVPVAMPAALDTLEDLRRTVSGAANTDLLVFSGGSSVGERDLIIDVVNELGEITFHGISVKPGKPMVLGRIGATPVLGMPGNPTSCLSNSYLFLAPMLRRMARLPATIPRRTRLPLAKRIASTADRHQFYTVRIVDGTVLPAFKSSSDITSMSRADGYIEIPAGTSVVEEGSVVEVVLF